MDQCGAAWAAPVEHGATQVDYGCKCLGGLPVGSGFYGVHDVADVVGGVSAADVAGVVNLTAGTAGKGVDVLGAT